MIKLLTKENFYDLNDKFLTYDYLEKEFANNPFANFLVLLEEDELIGYLYYSDIYDRIEINQFEVKEEKRKQGKGNLLLKYLIENNNKEITLEVRKTNIPAISLYKKYGFIEVATREKYYNGEDGILMKRGD